MQSKSQFSSGFSVPNGLSARSPVAQFDEFDYSAQALQPKSQFSSGFLAHNDLSARSPVAQFDEFDYSVQAMQPRVRSTQAFQPTRPQLPESSNLV